MKIKSQQYALALFELVKDKKGQELEKIVANFARLLTKRNDSFQADKIALEFENLWYQENSVVRAEIKTARSLAPAVVKDLAEKLKKISGAKELDLSEKVETEVIGGAVIKYGDKILDAGLKNRLQKFKEALAL
ncbi:ATP synthase F1 subunit delta [Patescibacteria group bacterium]|nr:ATP synthase F1 subunit delta [Patescibacteria group bacterium]